MTAEKKLLQEARRRCLQAALDSQTDTDKYIKAASLISQALNVLNSNLVRL